MSVVLDLIAASAVNRNDVDAPACCRDALGEVSGDVGFGNAAQVPRAHPTVRVRAFGPALLNRPVPLPLHSMELRLGGPQAKRFT